MKLSTKFIILGVVAVVASTGNGLVGAAARYKMTELGGEQEIVARVIQHNMDSDMKNDAIWEDVLGSILLENSGSNAAAEIYKKQIGEDVAAFNKMLSENLEQKELPVAIRQQMESIRSRLKAYGDAATALIMNHAAADLPAKISQVREM